jgi:hypothetical protein
VGEWLVGAAGTALLVSLFLPWFDQRSGWESFAVTDVIVAVVALGALGLLGVTARFRSASPAVAYEAMLTLAATAAFAIVAIRLLSPPGDVVGRDAGAWLGLVASAGIAGASLVAMRDERLSRPGRLTDSSGVPVSAPAEVESLPAPPAASP